MDKDLDTPFECMLGSRGTHCHFCSQLNKEVIKAKVKANSRRHLTFFADSVRVTNKTWVANTNGSMLGHPAFRIHSTRACEARIFAFFIYTCKMLRAIRVYRAFRLRCKKTSNELIQGSLHHFASVDDMGLLLSLLKESNRHATRR